MNTELYRFNKEVNSVILFYYRVQLIQTRRDWRKKLMENHKIPYFYQDHLKMGLIKSLYRSDT